MKKSVLLVVFALAFMFAFTVNCNGQPRSNYEIFSENVDGATKYHFFLEKESPNPYQLEQGMDYLNPDVTVLKVGEASVPFFTVNLENDGLEYKIGVVAETSNGFYSGMGVGVGIVGTVPIAPAGVGLRKKL